MALMKDVALRFSLIYTREDYTECAAALDADSDRARAMVTDTVSLADAPAAFERLRTGAVGGGKLLIDPWLGRRRPGGTVSPRYTRPREPRRGMRISDSALVATGAASGSAPQLDVQGR